MKPKVEYMHKHKERNNPISFRSDTETRETRNDCSSNEDSSSDSFVVPLYELNPFKTIHQEHARPRHTLSTCLSINESSTSLCSSLSRFRTDFEDLKCKMQIFGESLNLCKCIAADFKGKLHFMEKRLQKLEKRQVGRTESNYSAIINMNKILSQKVQNDAKKLQMCGTEAEMREVAGRMCRNYLHGAWKTVDPKDLVFRRISGGLSNFLYYVALPDDVFTRQHYVEKDKEETAAVSDEEERRPVPSNQPSFLTEEPKKVLLRIYGQVHGDRAMDAIVTESVIFTLLSERKLGPKLYGVFSGGRIEQYIPARCLTTRELAEPALSMKIAEKMAAIHSMDVPLSKEPKWLWKKITNWARTVTEERLKSVNMNEKDKEIQKSLKLVDFDKEIEWIRKLVQSVDSPSMFCHNDMQEGNILLIEEEPNLNEDLSPRYIPCEYDPTTQDDANTSDSITSYLSDIGEPKLVLIDFEYCAYNYRGFDIANHFQEWVFDYTNPVYPFYFEHTDNTPTLEQKEIFIKEYLKHANPAGDEEPSIDDINHVLAEVDAFSIVSNFFWSLWSFVNASKSQIPFGYWEYGLTRLQTYQRLKQEHIKKESSGIPQKRKICEVDI